MLGPEAVAEMLPGRTVCSVKRMANRLRLTGPNHRQWSAEEDQALISNYQQYGASRVAELTGRTVVGVIHRASHLREAIKAELLVSGTSGEDKLTAASRSKGTQGGRPPKHTIQSLNAYAKKKGGQCLSLEYLGLRKEKHHWRCADGHTWYAAWGQIQKGYWCPECRETGNSGDTIKKKTKVQVRRTGSDMKASIKPQATTPMDAPQGGEPIYQDAFTKACQSIKTSQKEVARIMALSNLPAGVVDDSIILELAAKADPIVAWHPYRAEALSIQLLAFLEAEGYALDKIKIGRAGKVTQWPVSETVPQEQKTPSAATAAPEDKYLTTEELAARIKYDARSIRSNLKDRVLFEGLHYFRPFGGRKILYIWETVEASMRDLARSSEGAMSSANEE